MSNHDIIIDMCIYTLVKKTRIKQCWKELYTHEDLSLLRR